MSKSAYADVRSVVLPVPGRETSLVDFLTLEASGKRKELPERNEDDYNGSVADVTVPAVLFFKGSDKEKKINGEPLPLGLPDVRVFTDDLPSATVAQIFIYGFTQMIADSYASAKDVSEAQAKFRQRLENILSGNFTVRRAVGTSAKKAGANPDYRIVEELFSRELTALTRKQTGLKEKPIAKLKDESKTWESAWVDSMKLLLTAPKVRAAVDEEKARRAAVAEELAAEMDDDDILADIFGEESEAESAATDAE